MLMGDINDHINCNETDFIINHSDNVLVNLWKKLTVRGQWSDILGEKSPTWKFKMLFKKDALQIQ
jgi:hypothetical protein